MAQAQAHAPKEELNTSLVSCYLNKNQLLLCCWVFSKGLQALSMVKTPNVPRLSPSYFSPRCLLVWTLNIRLQNIVEYRLKNSVFIHILQNVAVFLEFGLH